MQSVCLKVKNNFLYTVGTRANTLWSQVQQGPPDSILGLTEAFRKEPNPKKMNLGVGAYRDDDGKPYVLPVVRKAEDIIREKQMDKEYAPISGLPRFCKLSIALALGDNSDVIASGRNTTVQGLSGTGSLWIGAVLLNKFYPGNKTVYVPIPTWANHHHVFSSAGLAVKYYKYYNSRNYGLDFHGLLDDVRKIPEGSIILLHPCAHNPTGVDPTPDQWDQITDVISKRNLFTFFDMAYQVFATGDPAKDAYVVRLFAKSGHKFALAQSYAKNMGLYGERIGALSIITDNKEEARRVLSQMKIIIRGMYATPPIHGARLVSEVLGSDALKAEWIQEAKSMAERVIFIRAKLKKTLEAIGSPKKWDHITNQLGMFCYTGMTPAQVGRLIKEFAIYLPTDGRISMAGVTTKNVDYLANSMHAVTK